MRSPDAGPKLAEAGMLRSGGSAVLDQVLSSGTQLLLVVLVAHRASATVLGAVSIAIIVHGFLLGSVRAMVGDVALIRCRRVVAGRTDAATAGEEVVRQARVGLTLALAFGVTTGAMVALAGWVLGGDLGAILLVIAMAAPVVHAQDLLRSVAYGANRIVDATVMDGTWLFLQGVLSAGLFATGRADATSLVLAWTVGGALGLAIGMVRCRLRPSPNGIRRWMEADGRRGLGFFGDYVVSTGLVQAAFLVLGAIVPLAQFGAFRLAFLAISPLANVLAGVRSLTLASVVGAGTPSIAFGRARRFGWALGAIAAAYGILVTVLPRPLGEALFGPVWSSARELVAVVALGELFRLSSFPAIDFVKAHGAPVLLVRTRAATSAVLVVSVIAGALLAGTHGAVWGIGGALLIAAVVWWRQAANLSTGG